MPSSEDELADTAPKQPLALTLAAAGVTLLVIVGVLAGPSVVTCFNAPGGMGQCLRGEMAQAGLLPQPAVAALDPADPAQEPAAPVTPEPPTQLAEPAPAVAEPVAEAPDSLVAATFGLLRAEPDGSVVIAGSGTPGSEVEVYANEDLLGTTMVEPSGDWVFVPATPLAPGELEITLGEAGKPGRADDSFIVAINEDKSSEPLVVASTPGSASQVLQGLDAPEPDRQLASADPIEPPPAPSAEPVDAPPSPPAPEAPVPGSTPEPAASVAPATPEPAPQPPAPEAATLPVIPAPPPQPEPAPNPAVVDSPAAPLAPAPQAPEVAATPEPPAPATQPEAAPNADAADTQTIAPAGSEPPPTEPAPPAVAEPAVTSAEPAPVLPVPVAPALDSTPPTIDAIEIEGDRTFFAGAGPDGADIRLYVDDVFIADAKVSDGRWLVEAGPVLKQPSQRVRIDLLQPGTAEVASRAEVDFVVQLPAQAPIAIADADTPAPAPVPAASRALALDAPAPVPATPAPSTPELPAVTPEAPVAEPQTPSAPPAPTPPASGTTVPVTPAAPAPTPVPETPAPVPETLAPAAESVTPALLPTPANAEPTPTQPAPAAAPVPATRPATEPEPEPTPAPQPETEPTPAPIVSTDVAPAPSAPALAPDEPTPTPDIPTMVAVAVGDPDAERFASGKAIIRRGDNLWTIARRVYGQGLKYTTIYEANTGQIRDPDRIYPGQVFALPENTPN